MKKTKNWTITRTCTRTEKGYFPEVNLESLSGIDITVWLYRPSGSARGAMTKLSKVLKKIFPGGIEKLNA